MTDENDVDGFIRSSDTIGFSTSSKEIMALKSSRWNLFTHDELRVIADGLHYLDEHAWLDVDDDDGFKAVARLLEELDKVVH